MISSKKCFTFAGKDKLKKTNKETNKNPHYTFAFIYYIGFKRAKTYFKRIKSIIITWMIVKDILVFLGMINVF